MAAEGMTVKYCGEEPQGYEILGWVDVISVQVDPRSNAPEFVIVRRQEKIRSRDGAWDVAPACFC